MNEEKIRPRVGLGVYIRKNGKVLFGHRKGSHQARTWSPPGGHLDMNESWEECARREVMEETGIEIKNIRFMTATNDIMPAEGKHYITVAMVADWKEGEVDNREPDKCDKWEWFAWNNLPSPLAKFVSNFIETGYNPLTI